MARRIVFIIILALLVGVLEVYASGRGICFQVVPNNPWAQNAQSPLDLNLNFGGDTADNQGMHPDIEYWPSSFGPNPGATVIGNNRDGYLDTIIASSSTPRWKYWMVFTPYPYCLASYEDPHIRVSDFKDSGWIRPYAFGDDPTDSLSEDDTVWVKDPIYDHSHFPFCGHSSDPEFLYSPEDGKLYVLFQTTSRYQYCAYVKAISSPDGITWDETQAFNFTSSQGDGPWIIWNLLSPTICRESPDLWDLWTVDQINWQEGTQLIRLKYSAIGGNWIRADTCAIAPPDPSLQIWHTKVVRSPLGSSFFLLATVNTINSTSSDTFGQYLYVSQSGIYWDLVGEIIKNGTSGSWDYETYRSTFLFERESEKWTMPIWYSGSHMDINNHVIWGIGYTEGYIRWRYGDANGDCNVNVLDITFLINFIYKHGSSPDAAFEGDIDGNCRVNILDVTYLINSLYKNGPTPAIGCD